MVEKFILFVSGIPEGTSYHGLISYFKHHGFTIRIFHRNYKPRSAESHFSVGHCLIKVDSELTYTTLLGYRRFEFMGRRLMVSPFLQGAHLHRANSQKNKRRIVVKLVPSFVHESELVLCLERYFGAVESIYKFKDSPFSSVPPSIKASSANSFSVMLQFPFNDPAFTVLRIEIIPGKFIYVERFDVKQKKKDQYQTSFLGQHRSNNSSCENSAQPTQTSIVQKVEDFKLKVQKLIHGTVKSRDRSLDQEYKLKDAKDSNRISRSLDLAIDSLKGYRRAMFLEELQSKCHHVKPTTKSFQWLRREEPEYLATFQLKNTWIAKTNFKVNMETSSRKQTSPFHLHHRGCL